MLRTVFVGVFATFALTMPVIAQDDAVENGEPEVAADAAPAAEEEVVSTHDWEFALQPTQHAPSGAGVVKVTEGDAGQALVVEVEGLPLIDELDQEDRDVNAYTVWIVPSKERVKESTLAGVVTVGPEGTGAFESATSLETFGIIVTATPDGAPEAISGVPVLTGIPVTSAAPATPAEGEADPAGDAAADEAPTEAKPEAGEPTDEPEPEADEPEPGPEPPAEAKPEAGEPTEPEPEPTAAEPAFEPPPSEDRPPAELPPSDAGDLVYLQVGAFSSAARATDLSKRLKAEGFVSTIQDAVIDGRRFYRVRVGPFRPATEAERMDEDREKLTALGYPAEPVRVE